MWIFTRNGFVGLVQHPQQADKLVFQTQTREEIEQMVRLLDEVGGTMHVVEQATDGFARFTTVTTKDVAAQVAARLVAEIDYQHFVQAMTFDYGTSPQFLIWTQPSGLQVGRIKPY